MGGIPSGMVASMPIFAVMGSWPFARSHARTLGSTCLACASLMTMTSLSACTRNVRAHSTCVGSEMSMSSSTTIACLVSGSARIAISAFLPPPARLRMEAITDQRQALPSVTATRSDVDARRLEHVPHLRLGGGGAEPRVLPRHLEELEHRVAPPGDRGDLEDRVGLEVAVHAGELAERPLVLRPPDR